MASAGEHHMGQALARAPGASAGEHPWPRPWREPQGHRQSSPPGLGKHPKAIGSRARLALASTPGPSAGEHHPAIAASEAGHCNLCLGGTSGLPPQPGLPRRHLEPSPLPGAPNRGRTGPAMSLTIFPPRDSDFLEVPSRPLGFEPRESPNPSGLDGSGVRIAKTQKQ